MPTWSYNFGANPPIDVPRMLASDRTQFAADGTTPVFFFWDDEIIALTQLQAGQFQSGQFYSGTGGRNLPPAPVSLLRVGAACLDCMAANKARLAGVLQALDIKLDPSKAAQELRAQANQWRQIDDESGAFAIFEQCTTYWSFRDRFWSQVQRQSGV